MVLDFKECQLWPAQQDARPRSCRPRGASRKRRYLGNADKRQTSHRINGGEKQVAKANGRLEPDREQLKTFIKALFKHAGTEGYVSIRSFYENEHQVV